MADSQVPFQYDEDVFASLDPSLSADRFATYLRLSRGDRRDACLLYLYNARLSKSFLFPIHMAEVMLRNSLDRFFCRTYGIEWPEEQGFLDQLTQESRDAMNRAKAIVLKNKGPNAPRGQLVSTLMFDFWSNLFRPHYDRPFWQIHLGQIVPSAPVGTTRHEIQNRVREINKLRNRIAHHEPIVESNATSLHASIIGLVDMIDPQTARWVRHHSTVSATIRTRPLPGGITEPTFGERCDGRFQDVKDGDSLVDVMRSCGHGVPAIVSRDAEGRVSGVLLAMDLVRYIHDVSEATGSLVDLSAHRTKDVVDVFARNSWTCADVATPMSEVAKLLQTKGIRAVLATELRQGEIAVRGYMLRAHRRY